VVWAEEILGYHADPLQAEILRSRSKKIILNCSRQSGKSTTSAVLALHESIYRSPSFVLIVAPTEHAQYHVEIDLLDANIVKL